MDEDRAKKVAIGLAVALALTLLIAIIGWRSAAQAGHALDKFKGEAGTQRKNDLAAAQKAREEMGSEFGKKLDDLEKQVATFVRNVESMQREKLDAHKYSDALHRTAITKTENEAKALADKIEAGEEDLRKKLAAEVKKFKEHMAAERKWVENYVKGKLKLYE